MRWVKPLWHGLPAQIALDLLLGQEEGRDARDFCGAFWFVHVNNGEATGQLCCLVVCRSLHDASLLLVHDYAREQLLNATARLVL